MLCLPKSVQWMRCMLCLCLLITLCDAICVLHAACGFPPICVKCIKMKNTVCSPISFIYPLQPSPTKVCHVPMMEMLVNGMQWKSKHKNMVNYQGASHLLYKKQRQETGVKDQRD